MTKKKVEYTPEVVAYLKKTVDTHTLDEIVTYLNENYGGGFVKQNVSAARCKRGIKPKVHPTQFKPGHEPVYKGKKFKDVLSPSKYAQWKAKHSANIKPRTNRLPIGTISLHGGIPRIKVIVDDKEEWRLLKDVVWEEYNGEIPKGYCVTHLNKNKEDCDIHNLALLRIDAIWYMGANDAFSEDPEVTQAGIHMAHIDRKVRDFNE